MAQVELIAQRGKIEAHIGTETVLFKSKGAESEVGHWPVEYLLAALGSCFAGTVFAYAQTKNFPLEKVVSRISGELASSPSRVQKIEMEVELIGNLTYEEKERILKAGEKGCTVMNTLRGGVEEIVTKLSY
ncbi:MAG TPA: OsmC family protein [Candidatus Atribacteria bacterium]|nr:OsmC family protein [Candidatus Atribacteria bacterium]